MNRFAKTVICSLALAAVMPVMADEAEDITVADEAVGYTPVAVSLASPVQLPWGMGKWDVFGLDLGLFYTDNPKMYGLDVTVGGSRIRQDMMGAQICGLFNWNAADVYGMRASAAFNWTTGTSYGFEFSGVTIRKAFWGIDLNWLGSYGTTMKGIQISCLANIATEMQYGWAVGGIVNFSPVAYGCQTALVYNHTDELHGCQIALVNFAETCPWGFQIGLVNIILDNTVKVLPIVNAYF